MKLEKILKTMVLLSALLVATSAAAGAAETAASSTEAPPAPAAAEAAAAPGAPGSNCDRAASAPLFQASFEKETAGFAGPNCGTCSTANCSGLARGQMCWTGGENPEWAHCNIYEGHNFCPTGGWACQCGP